MKTPERSAHNMPIVKLCGICKQAKALYDAPTVLGPWAYMCEACYQQHAAVGASEIGTKII